MVYTAQGVKRKRLTAGVAVVADDTVMRTMLFDFYGELLTDKQREYYDLHYNEDLSLYEIAEQNGVSRQAVWDIIRRAEATMAEMECKTGFIAKAEKRADASKKIEALAKKLPECGEKAQILTLLHEIAD